MKHFNIAIHGGAGTILHSSMTADKEAAYKQALEEALAAGYLVLESGGSSLDAVVASVVSLEDCPLFNAGKGAVFTHDGMHEMDAAVMEGRERKAGAVAGVSHVQNPVQLARAVMDRSEHVLLCGIGAEAFARKVNLPFQNDEYFFVKERYAQLLDIRDAETTSLDHTAEKKFGTVGAVAVDQHGDLAAATSTGGMTNKRFGRAGDTPVIGAGTYANNNTCAVSCTGHGEYFLRAVVAYDVSCLMEYKGLSLEQACQTVVKEKLVKLGGEGGLIAIDASGNCSLTFNSEGMYRGMRNSAGKSFVDIYA
jgi:beta-aspartyl-peptidase (threonine type)